VCSTTETAQHRSVNCTHRGTVRANQA
jgi:hypothetical protein